MRLLFFLLLSFVLCNLRGQTTLEIKGKVIDRNTHKPIPFCAVALAGTSLGSITDEEGHYVISNVPRRPFEIVSSHIAYHTVVLPFNPDYPRDSYNMSLKPKVTELETVSVETRGRGKVGRLKRRNLETFKKLIFGELYDRKQIEITNEEVLDFKDKMNSTLTSKKTYDLNIRNDYLGYEIQYLKLSFNLSNSRKTFVGYPIFREMEPENDTQLQTWEANRLAAYKGSLQHFFMSLIDNKVEDEGFIANMTNFDPSRKSPHGFTKKTDFIRTKDSNKKKANLLIEFNEEREYYEMKFTDVIEVYFFDDQGRSSESYLKVNAKKVSVSPSGSLINPLSVIVFGSLAQKGVYQMLPSNYQPEN